MSSPFFLAAADEWREVRRAWADLIEAMFAAAEEECRGTLLNARGREVGVDPFTLFYGTERRALAYASEELVDWWREHPRVPFVVFEAQAARERDLQRPLCESCGEVAA